jgi:hypothetical protein
MKKIVMLPVLFLIVVSCSKSSNEEVATNTTPTELIGTWKYTGYYDDQDNEPNGSNYHLYNESFSITFKNDGTFQSNYNDVITTGTYVLNTNSFLVCSFTANAVLPIPIVHLKINHLTNSVLIVTDSSIPNPMYADQLEKVVTNPVVSGKQ